jgi:hypothetical protein
MPFFRRSNWPGISQSITHFFSFRTFFFRSTVNTLPLITLLWEGEWHSLTDSDYARLSTFFITCRLRRSRTHRGIRDISRKFRTRAYTKDLDQIHDDLKEGNVEKLKNQPVDADKAGLGQHYCVYCAYVYRRIVWRHLLWVPH